ncbi:MAG TPA: hypothetical protein VMZ11_06595 [Mycobacteriales bacterium]|nr:hypothetical protein [Mycobacteriales bacterium]
MIDPAPFRDRRSRILRASAVGVGLSIGALELALSAVSWVPHVRVHLIGWAVWPLVLVAPGTLVAVWLAQRSGADLGLLRVLPKRLVVPGVTAMVMLGLSFGAAIVFKRGPAYVCESVYLDGRYGLDCHGDLRYASQGEFYDVRAAHLRFVSGGVGYFAVASALIFAALGRRKRRGHPDGA